MNTTQTKCDRKKVVADFLKTRSYTETAGKNNITRQRVEQIVKSEGVTVKAKFAHFTHYGELCPTCGRKLYTEVPYGSRGFCSQCYPLTIAKNKGRKHRKFRSFNYPKNCVQCNVPFSKENPPQSEGLCEKCYMKTPAQQERRHKYMKSYSKRSEVKKRRSAHNKKYYWANRDKLLAYQREHRRLMNGNAKSD